MLYCKSSFKLLDYFVMGIFGHLLKSRKKKSVTILRHKWDWKGQTTGKKKPSQLNEAVYVGWKFENPVIT